MKNPIFLAGALLPALALAQQKAFTPIDMAALGLGNTDSTGIGAVSPNLFPYGNPTQQGGVPFIIRTPDVPNSTWPPAWLLAAVTAARSTNSST